MLQSAVSFNAIHSQFRKWILFTTVCTWSIQQFGMLGWVFSKSVYPALPFHFRLPSAFMIDPPVPLLERSYAHGSVSSLSRLLLLLFTRSTFSATRVGNAENCVCFESDNIANVGFGVSREPPVSYMALQTWGAP